MTSTEPRLPRTAAVAFALLLPALGCGGDAASPTAPEGSPGLASAVASSSGGSGGSSKASELRRPRRGGPPRVDRH